MLTYSDGKLLLRRHLKQTTVLLSLANSFTIKLVTKICCYEFKTGFSFSVVDLHREKNSIRNVDGCHFSVDLKNFSTITPITKTVERLTFYFICYLSRIRARSLPRQR